MVCWCAIGVILSMQKQLGFVFQCYFATDIGFCKPSTTMWTDGVLAHNQGLSYNRKCFYVGRDGKLASPVGSSSSFAPSSPFSS
jgi:hypothetical protein